MADPSWTTPEKVTNNIWNDDYPILIVERDGYQTVVHRADKNLNVGAFDPHLYSHSRVLGGVFVPATTAIGTRIDNINANSVDGYNNSIFTVSQNEIIYSVWSQTTVSTGAHDVYFSQRPRGGAWATPENVTSLPLVTDNAVKPCCAVDNSGRVFVVYSEIVAGSYAVKTRYRNVAGTWGGTLVHGANALAGQAYFTICNNPQGDIWIAYDSDNSTGAGTFRQMTIQRLNYTSPLLDPSSGGSWTTISTNGQYQSATLMQTGGPLDCSISSISRNEFLFAFSGSRSSDGNYVLYSNWVIAGASPVGGPLLALQNKAGSPNPFYYPKCDIAWDGTGVIVVAPTEKVGGDTWIQYFVIKNNVASSAKRGPHISDVGNGGTTVFFPITRVRPLNGKFYICWGMART